MKNKILRILFLADTHLGIDMPLRPRIERRRRGEDFFHNYRLALKPAFEKKIDMVVHGGDVFFRSRVAANIALQAFEPLIQIADSGIPVIIVPGNHERSKLPYPLLVSHPHIYVFRRPQTFLFRINGLVAALSGFPYYPKTIKRDFAAVLEKTGWRNVKADIRLLCIHHIIEGAVVGPADYVFRRQPDVIQGVDLPSGFAGFLSGHIHRFQTLDRSLSGKPFPAPVFYPGSIERTSFAEKSEKKGYLIIEAVSGDVPGGRVDDWSFVELPARPMIEYNMKVRNRGFVEIKKELSGFFAGIDPDSIVRIRAEGVPSPDGRLALNAGFLRELAPSCMNIDLKMPVVRPVSANRNNER